MFQEKVVPLSPAPEPHYFFPASSSCSSSQVFSVCSERAVSFSLRHCFVGYLLEKRTLEGASHVSFVSSVLFLFKGMTHWAEVYSINKEHVRQQVLGWPGIPFCPLFLSLKSQKFCFLLTTVQLLILWDEKAPTIFQNHSPLGSGTNKQLFLLFHSPQTSHR